MIKLVLIARAESWYLRQILAVALAKGLNPAAVLVGTRTEQILSKLDSLRALRAQQGYLEVVRRMFGGRDRGLPLPPQDATLAEMLTRHGIPLWTYDRINEGSIARRLLTEGRCLTLLCGAGIVDNSVILGSRAGCLNAHPSILPGLRGMDVVDWALLEGLPVGVTVHLVAAKIDAGDIVLTEKITPRSGETYAQFHARILYIQADALASAASDIINGTECLVRHELSKSVLKYRMPAALRDNAIAAFEARSKDI